MKSALNRIALVAAVISACTTLTASATNFFWDGANSTDWFDSGNWTPGGGPPTINDNAFLNTTTPAITVIDTNTAQARSVIMAQNVGDTGELHIINGGILFVGANAPFQIGLSGDATLLVRDNSVAFAFQNISMGVNQTGTADVTVRDTGLLAALGQMIVGDQGTANVTSRDGATVGAIGNTIVGNQATGNGTVDVSSRGFLGIGGFGSLLANVTVGNDGTGMVTVHDGGLFNAGGSMFIGQGTTGVGTVILRGEDSTGTNPSELITNEFGGGGNLDVGGAGTGTLEIHNGALAVGENIRAGRDANSIGSILVEGVGAVSGNPSELHATNDLSIGGTQGGPGGEGLVTIQNGGVVQVDNNMFVWDGTGDRGTLAVDSTYTLNVASTLSFDGGRLKFLGDGVNFINDVNLDNFPGPDENGMHVLVTDSNTGTVSGVLSGNGQLVKDGTGTLVLTNLANSYSGGTNINNGTLEVGTGSTALNSVFGTGDVNLNGDINTRLRTPEGTPLFYVISGDFNANTGQLYVQVGGTNPGSSDFMLTGGNANLDPNNSHLFVHRINGYNPNNGDEVEIIGTFGTVNGQFSDAPQVGTGGPAPNDFLGLIQPFAVYDNFTVDLVFGFAASFASVAKTPNQIATAEALDAAVAAGCIVNATNVLGNAPINTLRHAYDLIAPEELASMYEASFAQGMVQSLNLQHRMDDVRWGSTGFCADGFVVQDNHGYTKNDGKSVADKNPVEETPPPNYRWGSFITGTGELTKVGQEDDNAAGYQLNNASFTMGVDYRVTDHWAIGLSGGYTHTDGNLVDDGRLNTDGGRLGLYTTWYTGGFYVDASASGGWNQYDTRRTAYLGTEQGSTDGAEFDGMVAAGYDWKKGCWIFGPYADFEYSYVEFNSFTEGDTSLIPLHFPDQNQNAYRSNLGLRIAHEQVMKPGEGLTVVPEVRAAWRHDFGGTSYAIDSNFVGCDDTFTVHGPYIGTDSAVVDIGLTAYCTQQLSAYIFYQGQFGRDNYNNNAISGGLRFAF